MIHVFAGDATLPEAAAHAGVALGTIKSRVARGISHVTREVA